MKKLNHVTLNFTGKAIIKTFLCLVILLPATVLKSQESTEKPVTVYPSFGISFGFFNPEDANSYIQDNLGSYMTEYGTTDMFMYFELHGSVTIRMKNVDINPFVEFATAPKIIVVSGSDDDYSYYYNRISLGVSANYYIPAGSGKNAPFIGAGVHYNFMSFENFTANSPGFRIQAGYSLQFGKFNMQPYMAFNLTGTAEADDKYNGEPFDFNYTGFQIGIIMSAHKRINYK
jgi:hypothetical protein